MSQSNETTMFTNHLNELSSLLEGVDVEPFLAAVRGLLPKEVASKDPENTFRIVLQAMFIESLRNASDNEKSIFLASLMDELFSDEQQAPSDDSVLSVEPGCHEISPPPGLDGIEALRVFRETKNGAITGSAVVLVDASGFRPAAWGVLLHDIAKNIADSAAERDLVPTKQRSKLLDNIVEAFVREHETSSAKRKIYKPVLDS